MNGTPITCVKCGQGEGTLFKVGENRYAHKICPRPKKKSMSLEQWLAIQRAKKEATSELRI